MIKKKYIAFDSGYIRFKRLEINWSLYDWALPFEIQFGENKLIYFRILIVDFIFKINLGIL